MSCVVLDREVFVLAHVDIARMCSGSAARELCEVAGVQSRAFAVVLVGPRGAIGEPEIQRSVFHAQSAVQLGVCRRQSEIRHSFKAICQDVALNIDIVGAQDSRFVNIHMEL